MISHDSLTSVALRSAARAISAAKCDAVYERLVWVYTTEGALLSVAAALGMNDTTLVMRLQRAREGMWVPECDFVDAHVVTVRAVLQRARVEGSVWYDAHSASADALSRHRAEGAPGHYAP